MGNDDIIILALIAGAGGIGYLIYTKQLDLGSDSPKTKTKEDEQVVEDIAREIIPKNKDFRIPEFLEDFFDKPKENNILSGAQDLVNDWVKKGRDVFDKPKSNILSEAQDIVNDVVKGGQQLIENIVKPFTKPTTIIPKNLDFRKPTLDRYFFDKSDETSLDDLITDAFRGHPFRANPGATDSQGQKYRRYD